MYTVHLHISKYTPLLLCSEDIDKYYTLESDRAFTLYNKLCTLVNMCNSASYVTIQEAKKNEHPIQ